MRICLTLLMAFGLAVNTFAADHIIGEANPFPGGGSVDGWSGVTIMNGYGSMDAGERATTFNYYADPGRADGNHSVQPLIIQNAGGVESIWGIGPVDTPDSGGDKAVAWSSDVIPNDGNEYWPGIWQWNAGVDNTNGGLVPFGNTGSGMHQQDRDGTSYVPAIGDIVSDGTQHSSGAGGRSYYFNLETVPEPSSVVLALFGAAGLSWFIRRRK